jgi:RNA polymerase sigma factor (sigma-70 family)
MVVSICGTGVRPGIMAFPETRMTLIRRLASGGSEEDWRSFLGDYWGPVCRFALRFGARNLDEAEDVAAEVFEALWANRLLVRWVSARTAKLRTLLCRVVRNILANRSRVAAPRLLNDVDLADLFERQDQTLDNTADPFYAAWAEDLVQQAVQALAADYFRDNKADYVRVLYCRLCERLSVDEVARSLEIKPSDVKNFYAHARDRLAEKLEHLLRRQIHRYVPAEEAEAEFSREWQELAAHFGRTGGLEIAIQRSYDLLDPVLAKEHRGPRLARTLERLSRLLPSKGQGQHHPAD